MSSESSPNLDNDFSNTSMVRNLADKFLKQMKKENNLDLENTKESTEIKIENANIQKNFDLENNRQTPEVEMEPENIQKTPELQINFESEENILKMVRQSLREANADHLRMHNEIQEFNDQLNAFQNSTDNILKDLEFIKMLVLEANNRLDDLQASEQQKKPGSSSLNPVENL